MARKPTKASFPLPAPKKGVMAPKPAPIVHVKSRAKRIDDAIADIQQATDDVKDLDKRHMIDESLDEIRSATDGWAEDVENAKEDLREAQGEQEGAKQAMEKAQEALKVVHDWLEARLAERMLRCVDCERDPAGKCATCGQYKELLLVVEEVL